MQRMYSKKVYILIFLLPALILFCGVLIAPIGASAYYSLFNWNGLGAKVFIGLKNYKELFTSNAIGFMKALRNSLLLAGLSVFLQLPLALGLALTLGKRVKGERLFLSVYFMPVLISTVVIGQLWLKIYNPDYGILNVFLRSVGLENWTRIWLGTKKTALGAVFVPTLWQYVGYHMLLLYAGVKSVPPELREAAMLDGATDGQVHQAHHPHQRDLCGDRLPQVLRPYLCFDQRRPAAFHRGAEHLDDQHALFAQPLRHGQRHRRAADRSLLRLCAADQRDLQRGEVRP